MENTFFSIFAQSCISFAFHVKKIDSGFWELVNTALLIIFVVIFQVFLREFYFVLLVLILEQKKKK